MVRGCAHTTSRRCNLLLPDFYGFLDLQCSHRFVDCLKPQALSCRCKVEGTPKSDVPSESSEAHFRDASFIHSVDAIHPFKICIIMVCRCAHTTRGQSNWLYQVCMVLVICHVSYRLSAARWGGAPTPEVPSRDRVRLTSGTQFSSTPLMNCMPAASHCTCRTRLLHTFWCGRGPTRHCGKLRSPADVHAVRTEPEGPGLLEFVFWGSHAKDYWTSSTASTLEREQDKSWKAQSQFIMDLAHCRELRLTWSDGQESCLYRQKTGQRNWSACITNHHSRSMQYCPQGCGGLC